MEKDKRIAELEVEVRRLAERAELLEREKAELERSSRRGRRARRKTRAKGERAKSQYRADASRNIDVVLGGEAGEGLESRIGGVWLARAAAVMLMTAGVLGARVLVQTEAFSPVDKVLMAYGGSLVAILYGLTFANKRDLFAQAIFGTGLAGLYFATYAAFFIEGMI
ncbi:MAG TPA: DUF2339 domain-containing protein, partial [Candidatus Hydrogenedentes bacterium]|nr:DUF2339 domain-containing protein [Candidatus Hydrogenedentota bacterium]